MANAQLWARSPACAKRRVFVSLGLRQPSAATLKPVWAWSGPARLSMLDAGAPQRGRPAGTVLGGGMGKQRHGVVLWPGPWPGGADGPDRQYRVCFEKPLLSVISHVAPRGCRGWTLRKSTMRGLTWTGLTPSSHSSLGGISLFPVDRTPSVWSLLTLQSQQYTSSDRLCQTPLYRPLFISLAPSFTFLWRIYA